MNSCISEHKRSIILAIVVLCCLNPSVTYAALDCRHYLESESEIKSAPDFSIANDEFERDMAILAKSDSNSIHRLQSAYKLITNSYDRVSLNEAEFLLTSIPRSRGIGFAILYHKSIIHHLSSNYDIPEWDVGFLYHDILIVFHILDKMDPIDLDTKYGVLQFIRLRDLAHEIILESRQFKKRSKRLKQNALLQVELILRDKAFLSSKVR